MKSQLFLGALVATGTLCLAGVSSGHGGRYLGPWNVFVPGGCGPGGPGPPGSPSAGDPSSVNEQDGLDYSVWEFWWGVNKQAYLHNCALWRNWSRGADPNDCFTSFERRDDAWRPSKALIRGSVVPALLEALKTETHGDIVTGSLIALAKIGDVPSEDGSPGFGDVMTNYLRSEEQQVSETAALALGILGNECGVPTLASLLHSDEDGQRLVGKPVPTRTRAFAGYALGLIGAETSDNEVRRTIVGQLLDALVSDDGAQPDVKVSVISALGVIPLDWPCEASASAAPETAITANRGTLLRYLLYRMSSDRQGERGSDSDPIVRAQYPIAVARLLASHWDFPEEIQQMRGDVIGSLLKLVAVGSKDSPGKVQQSACIALGMVGNAGGAGEEGGQNRLVLKELVRIAKSTGDDQTKYFALMALAQMGSRPGDTGNRELQREAETALTSSLECGRGQEQAWAAVALGVHGSALNATGAGVPPAIVLAVRAGARKQKNPWLIGGYAIGLGLMGDTESQDTLLGYLEKKEFSIDEGRGQIAVALGLMGATSSLEPINALIEKSKFRPHLITQASSALGLLSDSTAIPELIEMLNKTKGQNARASVASALGFIGHKQSVKPLSDMLLNKRESKSNDAARGYAAVALGIVCDKADLPWNLKYSFNVNYRATVPTQRNSRGGGILDIL